MCNKVKIECLSKTIKNRYILNNIYLEIKTGDIIGLFGRNGSGKSTLLSILFGVIKSDNIIFSFNNKRILSSKYFNKIFSLLPQFNSLPPNLPVKQILKITIETKDLDKILEDEFLNEIMFVNISTLSTGSQKYVEALTVLYSKSKFCLLDEPFSGL